MSVSYVREQDRILVRINTTAAEEFRIWVTQRLIKGLLPHLHTAAANLEASETPLADNSEKTKQLLSEFKKEETINKADFQTPYKAEVTKWPLGETPLLVTEVSMTPRGPGKLEISFDEKLPEVPPRGFKISLRPQLMHGLMHLMAQAIVTSEWPINPEAGKPVALVSSGGTEPEGGTDGSRPKYLN